MWSIALRTLVADRGKLVTALVGVVFSVVLVNVQGGLFFGLLSKVSLLVNYSRADIWVGHRRVHNVDFPEDIPKRWGDRILAIPQVLMAEPLIVGYGSMTLPSGGYEGIVLVGCDREELLADVWRTVNAGAAHVPRADGIVVDQLEDAKLEFPQVGDVREIAGRRARIAGKCRGIVGFMVNPYGFTSLEQAARYLRKPRDRCSYFLVTLKPGADAAAACREIERRAPGLDAFPREAYAAKSIDYWMTRTGLGLSFGGAAVLGVLVGVVIVSQTIYSSVLDRLSEFGALKAMGASEKQIYGILFIQSVTLALAGAAIGLASATFVERSLNTPNAPIVIPYWVSSSSCALVLVICLGSSLLPYLRVRRVDPVVVLQA
jgi:putative ABC transport system permease protein